MKKEQIQHLLSPFEKLHKGVFTENDLRAIFMAKSKVQFYREIKKLISFGVIKRFTKGLYLTPQADINVLFCKINQDAYISFETVLAKKLVIGSIPTNYIRGVKRGKKRIYENDNIYLEYLTLNKDLFFGLQNENGIISAIPEKAFLDTLYFYQKGTKFYFDIYSDINMERLDLSLVKNFLKCYKNPKFVTFVKNFLDNHQ